MTADTVVVLVVVMLGMLLAIWGASLIVRALASRASSVAMRLARRIPKRINTAPPTLSRVQFAFGMIVGPIACVAGSGLIAYILGLISLDGTMRIPWSNMVAFFVAMLAFGVLVVGYRWDKPRGRRRCPSCWYDYSGLDDRAPCPECGGVPASGKALFRTRRNRAMMGLAPLALVLAWGMHIAPTVVKVGWRGVFPNALLIGGFEHLPRTVIYPPTMINNGTLASRLGHNGLSDRERDWLSGRALRVLQTSDDPQTCMTAAYFARYARQRGADDDGYKDALDGANANMIRVAMGSYQNATQAAYAQLLLGEATLSLGPKTQEAVALNLEQILARYVATVKWDEQIALAGLLARFAPATPEVIAAARGVALGPALTSDSHDAACVALGMITARDNSARGQIVAEYEGATGTLRETIATVIAGSFVDPQLMPDPRGWPNVSHEGRQYTQRLLMLMGSGDAAIRNGAIAAARGVPQITRAMLDWEALKPVLLEIAAGQPESRNEAITTLTMLYGISADAVPTLVQMATDGDTTDLDVFSRACRRAQIDDDWRPVLAAVNARLEDETLDTATRDALQGVKVHLEGSLEP